MRILLTAAIIVFVFQVQSVNALSSDSLGATVQHPTFDAIIGIGFNYDLLKDPTDVSFEYPKAYFGFNLPLKKSVNLRDYTGYLGHSVDSVFNDTTIFTDGDEFRPKASARQNSNFTVNVEVPMLGGVASFSNIQNFSFNYQNVLGNPDIFINPKGLEEGMSFLLKGTINVPLDLNMYWETMTFGYAYRFNKYFTGVINLHRHIFTMDLRGKIDVDLMGNYSITQNVDQAGSGNDFTFNGALDYPSSKVYGNAYGHFESEVWSPTIGVKAWRFSLVSRFGISTRAKGELYAKYKVPFFIDPETFKSKYDFEDKNIYNNPDVRSGLLSNATDSISYSTKKIVNGKEENSDLLWKMPTGLTVSFDIIPQKLKLSYSKLFGDIQMKLDRIAKDQTHSENGNVKDSTSDSVVIDFGIHVDHVIMLQCNMFNSFLNLGVFSFDVRYGDEEHLLGKNMPYLKMGDAAMIPVLNLGTALGSKLQLLLELDVLPLPALKTGIYYHF